MTYAAAGVSLMDGASILCERCERNAFVYMACHCTPASVGKLCVTGTDGNTSSRQQLVLFPNLLAQMSRQGYSVAARQQPAIWHVASCCEAYITMMLVLVLQYSVWPDAVVCGWLRCGPHGLVVQSSCTSPSQANPSLKFCPTVEDSMICSLWGF